jgi:hypothetical protein
MGDAGGGGGLIGVEPRGRWIKRDDGCGGGSLVRIGSREEVDREGSGIVWVFFSFRAWRYGFFLCV